MLLLLLFFFHSFYISVLTPIGVVVVDPSMPNSPLKLFLKDYRRKMQIESWIRFRKAIKMTHALKYSSHGADRASQGHIVHIFIFECIEIESYEYTYRTIAEQAFCPDGMHFKHTLFR